MRCFECKKGKYATRVTDITADVRGEKFTVTVEAEVCNRCGSQVLTDPQSDAYMIASADAYREKHGLLTTAELKAIRKSLGLSQDAFARELGVGVASVKRWEAGLIQDKSHDELIRLKTDLNAAHANVERLKSRLRNSQTHNAVHLGSFSVQWSRVTQTAWEPVSAPETGECAPNQNCYSA